MMNVKFELTRERTIKTTNVVELPVVLKDTTIKVEFYYIEEADGKRYLNDCYIDGNKLNKWNSFLELLLNNFLVPRYYRLLEKDKIVIYTYEELMQITNTIYDKASEVLKEGKIIDPNASEFKEAFE
jgi:hypothetical protein